MNIHATKHVTGARAETLSSLVERIYDDLGRDRRATVDKIIAEIRRRPSLQEEAYRIAANELVGNLMSRDRAVVRSGGEAGQVYASPAVIRLQQPSAAAVKARVEAERKFAVKLTGLYTMTYRWNGGEVILGNATPEELKPIAKHYYEQGATMVREARWLDKVIASAKSGVAIHKSLTLKELERMQKDTKDTAV